ncbi:ATP-binding protein [Marinilabilia salmonicolor]|uniref:histidine kinase n=1 Tax=Marinilabilia salmonicolor TaxID=989 RepID=A0A368VBS1_9BACT|nr:ATP-binding protein [Marinilabilia salmonicolor]RCW38566.1 signal transduction histidine kinase [Marinilabilia salmonicolor]
MPDKTYDLFLLMVNLSQYKNKVLIISLFIEGLNASFQPVSFQWKNKNADNTSGSIEVCTRNNRFGYIEPSSFGNLSVENTQFLLNAIQMLAIILEKNDQEKALNTHKNNLTKLVDNKTKELRDVNETLNNQIADYQKLTTILNESNKQLIVAKEKAEESSRLKTSFLRNISHEIRTPLNSIIGFSELMNMLDIEDDVLKNYTQIISKSGTQLLSIITDILTISSIDAGQEKLKKEIFSLNQLMEELLEVFKLKATNKDVFFKIIREIPSERDFIILDKKKLTQILSSLLSNAVKFTERGQIQIGCTYENQQLSFFVKDTGIGIPENRRNVIFERFAQASEAISVDYGGTGLGLSIAKGFVELMNGRIWVESKPGVGSVFHFTIPLSEDQIFPNLQTMSGHMKSLISGSSSHTILIAEDYIYNFMYLKAVLEPYKVKVIHAENGKEAVDICLKDGSIDLVFMDLKMPVMDGKTAASLIKREKPDLKIIAQTAYVTDISKEESANIFDDYLTKPFSPQKIISILAEYLS